MIDEQFNFETAKYNSYLHYANLFSSINLVNSNIFVSHGNILSKYNLLRKKWITHIKFVEPVVTVFNLQKDDVVGNFELVALTKSDRVIKDIMQFMR